MINGPVDGERINVAVNVFDGAGVPLRLIPGGEINLRADTPWTAVEALVSYGMLRKFVAHASTWATGS